MIAWTIGLLAGAVALYAMHRLALRLERSGWIRYRNAAPDGGAAGGALFAELQKIYEPAVRHVYEMKDQDRPRREADGGDPSDEGPAQHPTDPTGSRPPGGVS